MRFPVLFFILNTQLFCLARGLKNGRIGRSGKKENLFWSKKLPPTWSSLAATEPGYNYTEKEMETLKIWPYGIIPYYIDDYSFDHKFSERLRQLLLSVNTMTGLRFTELPRPPTSQYDRWVLFLNRRGKLECEDYSTSQFTIKGVQRVVLGYDCVSPGSDGDALVPLILALAGVPPQHNSIDRDKYITVVMENIIPEKRHLFEKVKDNEWLFDPVDYDFYSAGHYDFHKYTLNGSATIIPKTEVTNLVGETNGVSYEDIWKIRMLYNYISQQRPQVNPSDCSKIFKPKDGLNDYKPQSEEVILPRKKPNRYLGLDHESVLLNETGKEPFITKPPKKVKLSGNIDDDPIDSNALPPSTVDGDSETTNTSSHAATSDDVAESTPLNDLNESSNLTASSESSSNDPLSSDSTTDSSITFSDSTTESNIPDTDYTSQDPNLESSTNSDTNVVSTNNKRVFNDKISPGRGKGSNRDISSAGTVKAKIQESKRHAKQILYQRNHPLMNSTSNSSVVLNPSRKAAAKKSSKNKKKLNQRNGKTAKRKAPFKIKVKGVKTKKQLRQKNSRIDN